MYRPDQSNFLAHFTTDRVASDKVTIEISAYDRLIAILQEKKLQASTMPWTNTPCVSFTECPWTSLIEHTKRYSPYGIGFSKPYIFSRNGSPVYYVRADQFKKQNWHKHLLPFVTPFWPAYRPHSLNEKVDFTTCDYSHEREWRTPHDLPFEYNLIEFIVLDTYDDLAKFPKELKDEIGREKFILMDNYKLIEKLWPVHKLNLEEQKKPAPNKG